MATKIYQFIIDIGAETQILTASGNDLENVLVGVQGKLKLQFPNSAYKATLMAIHDTDTFLRELAIPNKVEIIQKPINNLEAMAAMLRDNGYNVEKKLWKR